MGSPTLSLTIRLRSLLPAVLAGLWLAPATPAAVVPVTWCGTDQAATDRVPDASSGLEWHVVYAFPSDGTDNFAALASGIATDLASIAAWWSGQDPTRAPRFDVYAFPGCELGFASLDISRSQLPNPSASYAPLDGRAERIVGDLNAAPFGFTSPDKKYLVYYDGPVEGPSTCGQGTTGFVDGGPRAYAIVFLSACGQAVGTGETGAAITAAHELVHTMNALPFPAPSPPPPHVCPGDPGHPCDSAQDLLYPTGTEADTLSTRILDAGRDDYYGHSGAWWDVQDSLFLSRLGGPDLTPPAGPGSLTVTSERAFVTLSWPRATDDVGPVSYRVYRDGTLVATTTNTTASDQAAVKDTIVFGVRAVDAAGLLGPLQTARFKVGFGIVDESGRLVRDTVAPPAVRGLRVSSIATGIRLRWRAASDPGGIRGYLVELNRRRYRVVRGTSLAIPKRRSRGTWSVRAIDRAGNVGPRLRSVRVR